MLTIFHTASDFGQKETTTVVLPIGAIEQHGSHLPVGTDTIVAVELAQRIAERLDAYLLPPLAVTSSIEHRLGRGTVYLKPATLAAVLTDTVASLHESGYSRVLLVNFHGGNWIVKPTVRQLNRDYADMEIVLLDLATLANARLGEVIDNPAGDVHAGEMETSIMLYLDESRVGTVRPTDRKTGLSQSFLDYFDMTELTGDGYWGYPEAATKEKGEKLMELLIECAFDYLALLEEQKRIVRSNG
ncbi:creatininase family protein [Paenibacillus contaminans]|uniref:creatininase family protein n=1 Tax=Paenibacillus contaminans TaxID=450362 RepID=UPI001314DF73|nr:creatininase family protein [Paenibacillus contaminans]